MKQSILAPLSLFFAVMTGLFFTYFFVEQTYGISVPIFTVIFLLFIGVLKYFKRGANGFGRYDLLAIPLFLLSLSFVYHQTISLLVINAFFILLSIIPLTYFSLYPDKYKRFSYFNGFLAYIHNFAGGIIGIPPFIKGLFNSTGAIAKSKYNFTRLFIHVLVGCVITVPILGIFTYLLASADDAFKDLISKVDVSITGTQAFFVIFITAVALYVFTGIFLAKVEPILVNQDYSERRQKGLSSIITGIVFLSTNLLFITFIIVQFVYLFGNHDKVVDLGLTYSQYAVRGFWELQVVSILALIMLYVFKRITSANNRVAVLTIKALLSIFILNVLVIIFSAHSRMNLYESGYGYTQLRLYTHVFMGFEAVLFIFLFVSNLYRPVFKYFSLFSFMTATVFLLGLNILVPDRIIASRNIHRYEDGKDLDITYLLSLSSDSYMKLKDVDFANKKIYQCELLRKQEDLEKSTDSWGEFNISKYYAKREIKKQTKVLDDAVCQKYVLNAVDLKLKEYKKDLEANEFNKAAELYAKDSESVDLVQDVPASFKVNEYTYTNSISDMYPQALNIRFKPEDLRLHYYTNFGNYFDFNAKMYYSNNYNTNRCLNDYLDFVLVNGEVKITNSSNLPLVSSKSDQEYDKDQLRSLGSFSTYRSTSCY